MLLNDNEIYIKDRSKLLDTFSNDLEDIFIQHFAYIFYLKDNYMASTSYIDSLDSGLLPEEGSQYWVEPFIQNVFDNVIKTKRPDIAEEIKEHTAMLLQ